MCPPVPETDHSIWCQKMSISSGSRAIFLLHSPHPLSLFQLTSLTCHDQMGALRVQQLTWTTEGHRSIISPFLQLAFFLKITLFLYHPSITPYPFLNQQILPFLFHLGWIVSVSVNFMCMPLPPPPPLTSVLYKVL